MTIPIALFKDPFDFGAPKGALTDTSGKPDCNLGRAVRTEKQKTYAYDDYLIIKPIRAGVVAECCNMTTIWGGSLTAWTTSGSARSEPQATAAWPNQQSFRRPVRATQKGRNGERCGLEY
jgi:hypothetical protein